MMRFVENNWPMTEIGRPATSGTGPARFTLQIPFSIFPLGQFTELDGLSSGQRLPVPSEGQHASVERCDNDFYILRIEGLGTREEAEKALELSSVGLMHLAVEKEIAIGFASRQADLDEEVCSRDPELLKLLRLSREQFARERLPEWKRPDGTFTDGGVSSSHTAILPEHQRIWELARSDGT
jgi:hypothetical protein